MHSELARPRALFTSPSPWPFLSCLSLSIFYTNPLQSVTPISFSLGHLAMTTSSDVWTTGVKSYAQYFKETRAPPPEDRVASETLNQHDPYPEAVCTQKITCFDPAALQHTLGPVTLNMTFVQRVLTETGPKVTPSNSSLWHFDTQPETCPLWAEHEADYYDWLIWAVCHLLPAPSTPSATHFTNAQRSLSWWMGTAESIKFTRHTAEVPPTSSISGPKVSNAPRTSSSATKSCTCTTNLFSTFSLSRQAPNPGTISDPPNHFRRSRARARALCPRL
ncbi:hypothetical protein B0H17DRAFT_419925 [Mycena rosella]|uniref:Uncharacterized protein n=1 Tax=Mycena rosella TaxID=1033263 RepID=A0AAD7G1N1_MYCRO|nr:hypothetical protein B0H17DRAFT_419925 [Mycena rosella]